LFTEKKKKRGKINHRDTEAQRRRKREEGISSAQRGSRGAENAEKKE
jgi:hypothetical protein